MQVQHATVYDVIPYTSHPYSQTRPERLGTMATLMGLTPAPLGKCRVLELGCSSGGNIIPLAELYPGGEFVAVDASARQVELAQEAIRGSGLSNVQILHKNILDVSAELGQFDYIICHGVFSWVPVNVQEKILSICNENLARSGVAFVSYNALPGWHMRGVIRDMMLYRSRQFENAEDQIRHARAIVELGASFLDREKDGYAMWLREEAQGLQDKADDYIFHDYMEENNHALYFHQFMDMAHAAGLQYLGEADVATMTVQNLPTSRKGELELALRNLADDVVQYEQYLDFLRNRMFRQTILCHKEAKLDRSMPADRVFQLYVASPAKPEGEVGDLRNNQKIAFVGPRATTTTNDPLVKAAMLHLGCIYPASVKFPELVAIARSALSNGAVVVDSSLASGDARGLAQTLLRGYVSAQVEFSTVAACFSTSVPERPMASRYARWQAERSDHVTNLRHETVRLVDVDRSLLRLLDGTRDRQQTLDAVVQLAGDRMLHVRENGEILENPSRITQVMAGVVDAGMKRLAERALLMK